MIRPTPSTHIHVRISENESKPLGVQKATLPSITSPAYYHHTRSFKPLSHSECSTLFAYVLRLSPLLCTDAHRVSTRREASSSPKLPYLLLPLLLLSSWPSAGDGVRAEAMHQCLSCPDAAELSLPAPTGESYARYSSLGSNWRLGCHTSCTTVGVKHCGGSAAVCTYIALVAANICGHGLMPILLAVQLIQVATG
ncbi:hypothetical protein BDN71DRAFT_1053604 [Pleurotus eryngii]|uniref:Uncharacterized protein n=1 Tax=Pleurotus eryngii TaxID=5323 RepID=A0A9P5ZW90_PLEER|nr:hypothetical protein BDN71DRAFT_1053604 [Pleurotus eryngii]